LLAGQAQRRAVTAARGEGLFVEIQGTPTASTMLGVESRLGHLAFQYVGARMRGFTHGLSLAAKPDGDGSKRRVIPPRERGDRSRDVNAPNGPCRTSQRMTREFCARTFRANGAGERRPDLTIE
jgi:hypothetical protein